MSYMSKRTFVSIGASVLLVVGYLVYALGKASPAPDDLASWAVALLVFVGISIAAQIVIQILFHIFFGIGVAIKEGHGSSADDKKIERILSSSMVEDEMVKLIKLKSLRVGYICAGVGFIVALVALALGAPAVVALHILFGACLIGGLVEGSMSIYLHEKGVQHG